MTLTPWWSAYAVLLVVLFVWAGRLAREAKQRDSETTEREIAPLLRSMERERGE